MNLGSPAAHPEWAGRGAAGVVCSRTAHRVWTPSPLSVYTETTVPFISVAKTSAKEDSGGHLQGSGPTPTPGRPVDRSPVITGSGRPTDRALHSAQPDGPPTAGTAQE